MRSVSALVAVAGLLAGCTQAEPTASAASAPASPAASAVPAPVSRSLGHYTLGDVRVDLRGAMRLPADAGAMRLLLTPEEIDADLRAAVLASRQFPGMALFARRIEGYPDRYPFVVVELRHEGAPEPANVRGYYVMAANIGEPNHTDNLNGMPGGDARVGRLQVEGEQVRMEFSGRAEIGGKPRSWAFDVEA